MKKEPKAEKKEPKAKQEEPKAEPKPKAERKPKAAPESGEGGEELKQYLDEQAEAETVARNDDTAAPLTSSQRKKLEKAKRAAKAKKKR